MKILTTVRRLVFIGLWVFIFGAAGLLSFVLFALGYIHGMHHWGWPPLANWLPEWAISVSFIGTCLLPPVLGLLLGLYERLPGTVASRPKRPIGFPMEPAPRPSSIP